MHRNNDPQVTFDAVMSRIFTHLVNLLHLLTPNWIPAMNSLQRSFALCVPTTVEILYKYRSLLSLRIYTSLFVSSTLWWDTLTSSSLRASLVTVFFASYPGLSSEELSLLECLLLSDFILGVSQCFFFVTRLRSTMRLFGTTLAFCYRRRTDQERMLPLLNVTRTFIRRQPHERLNYIRRSLYTHHCYRYTTLFLVLFSWFWPMSIFFPNHSHVK